MRTYRLIAALAAVLSPLVVAQITSIAAEPADGHLGSPGAKASWRGGPYQVGIPNQAGCTPTTLDTTCDTFTFTVDPAAVDHVLVAIAPDKGFEADDYDLFVFDDKGMEVARDADGDGYESVMFVPAQHPSTHYVVRVSPFAVGAGSTYHGVAARAKEEPLEPGPVQDCEEFVPATVTVLDSRGEINLNVLMLLDGVDPAVASQLMGRAATAYAALGIKLNVVEMRRAHVPRDATDSGVIIDAAKRAVGGVRPPGVHIVGIMTSKRMQALLNGVPLTVVGQADCIGGIRFDDRAFFVASDIRASENPTTGQAGTLNSLGFNVNVAAASEVLAHEMGHLMGAHHHYANCVEGSAGPADGPNDVSPCTMMFNSVNFASLAFGALEGKIVRDHAVSYVFP